MYIQVIGIYTITLRIESSMVPSTHLTTATTSSGLLIAGLILYGFSVPTLLPMLMLTLMNEPEVGAERMGMAGGLFFTIAEIGGFIGPLLMGIMVDTTGAFLAGVLVLAGAGLIFSSLMLRLRGYK